MIFELGDDLLIEQQCGDAELLVLEVLIEIGLVNQVPNHKLNILKY